MVPDSQIGLYLIMRLLNPIPFVDSLPLPLALSVVQEGKKDSASEVVTVELGRRRLSRRRGQVPLTFGWHWILIDLHHLLTPRNESMSHDMMNPRRKKCCCPA